MQVLTGVFLLSVVGYIAGWYWGSYEGNFDLLLLLVSLVTGLYWLAERYYFLPARKKAVQAFDEQSSQRNGAKHYAQKVLNKHGEMK